MGNLAGRLKHKIEIWENVITDNDNILGQKIWEPKLVKKKWAEIIPQTGSLLNNRLADTSISRTTHKIIVRYDADIKTDMWITVRGERYNILYILNPYLRNEWLEIFCEVLTI